MKRKELWGPGAKKHLQQWKETSITFCCKQLIKAKLFTAWACWQTLLVALRWVRVGSTGQWCFSSALLPSVRLRHLSSHLCRACPCHCCGYSLSDLPGTAFWQWEAKGPQCRWAPLTPHVASKHRSHEVFCTWGQSFFPYPIIFIFSLENRHLLYHIVWWGWLNWGFFCSQQYLPQPLLS